MSGSPLAGLTMQEARAAASSVDAALAAPFTLTETEPVAVWGVVPSTLVTTASRATTVSTAGAVTVHIFVTGSMARISVFVLVQAMVVPRSPAVGSVKLPVMPAGLPEVVAVESAAVTISGIAAASFVTATRGVTGGMVIVMGSGCLVGSMLVAEVVAVAPFFFSLARGFLWFFSFGSVRHASSGLASLSRLCFEGGINSVHGGGAYQGVN